MKNNTILVLIILIVIIWLLYNQKQENFLVTQKPITFTQCAWIYELNNPKRPLRVKIPSNVNHNTHTLILGIIFKLPPFWNDLYPTNMTHFYITQYMNDWYIHLSHNPLSNDIDRYIEYNKTHRENAHKFTFNLIAIPKNKF